LNGITKLSYPDDLIAEKQTGPEKGTLNANDLEFHQVDQDRTTQEQESAHEESNLPETPSAQPALNDFLVRPRLGKNLG